MAAMPTKRPMIKGISTSILLHDEETNDTVLAMLANRKTELKKQKGRLIPLHFSDLHYELPGHFS